MHQPKIDFTEQPPLISAVINLIRCTLILFACICKLTAATTDPHRLCSALKNYHCLENKYWLMLYNDLITQLATDMHKILNIIIIFYWYFNAFSHNSLLYYT